MKQILFFTCLIGLVSCVNQRQKSNITGRTDEVYFTPSDTRIKVYNDVSMSENQQSPAKPASKNYTGSYSDRLSNFGTSGRFNYGNYQPTLAPSLMYNNYTGWGMGLTYGSYNSPFSPYYGYNMPYANPFYSYGWGGNWMTGYNPYYTYNPFMYNCNPYGYGYGYGGYMYNNYNPYYYNNGNSYNSGGSGNYSRRTGVNSPGTSWQNNNGVRNSNNTPMRSDGNNGSYNSGRVNSSSSGSSFPGGGGGGSRSGGGGTSGGGSTRRR